MFGKREYIIHNNERITYDQAHDLVDRYATLLYQRGVRKGDRVAVASRNLPEWILLWWATHSLGACFVAVNAWAPPDSLIHCLLNADVKLLAVDPERAQALESKRHQLKGLCDSFFIMRPEGQVPEGYEDLQKTLDKTQRVALPKVDIQDQVRPSNTRCELSLIHCRYTAGPCHYLFHIRNDLASERRLRDATYVPQQSIQHHHR